MNSMTITARGFHRLDFNDADGEGCSIQESSNTVMPMIWLGRNKGIPVEGLDLTRMLLTQEIAAELIPLLQRFVDNGTIVRSQ